MAESSVILTEGISSWFFSRTSVRSESEKSKKSGIIMTKGASTGAFLGELSVFFSLSSLWVAVDGIFVVNREFFGFIFHFINL